MITEAIIIAAALLLQPLAVSLTSVVMIRFFPIKYPPMPDLLPGDDPLEKIEEVAERIARAMRKGTDDKPWEQG